MSKLNFFFISLCPLLPLTILAQKDKRITYWNRDLKVICWNEDTVNDYRFAMAKGTKFIYSIKRKDGLKEIKEQYTGTFYARDKKHIDTIYLKFKKPRPTDLCNYLVLEASGNYLIQYFTDGKKRIFLRFRHRPCFCFSDPLL